jgi:hypothetical protein
MDPFSTANGCPDASGDPMAARIRALINAPDMGFSCLLQENE